MSNLQARLAPAFLLSVAASLTLMAGPGSAARAADSCVTEPKAESPQGKHWYYRIERGSGRHCWYLRGEDEASARTPAAEPVATAKPAPQATTGNAPPRSLADAHAEFAPKAPNESTSSAASPQPVWPNPPATTAAAPAAATTGVGPGAVAPTAPADSQLASRWPQASGAPSTANATPQASLMVADAQADSAATTPAPAETVQASPPPVREVGSLQKLALVVFGALALAGISGSLVYRLAGARSRRRHPERWPQRPSALRSLADEARGAPWIAPDLSPTVPHQDVMDADVNIAHEDVPADRIEFGKSDDSFEKIEDFLARLTRQLQDELQTSRPEELENPRPH
jgi:hypothetical protein